MQEDENVGFQTQPKLPPIHRQSPKNGLRNLGLSKKDGKQPSRDGTMNFKVTESSDTHIQTNPALTRYDLPPGFLESNTITNPTRISNQVVQPNIIQEPLEYQQQPPVHGAQGLTDVDANSLSKNLSANVRLGFIRKVYLILLTQLVITAILTIVTLTNSSLRAFMIATPGLMWAAICLYVTSMYALACYPRVARSVPANYILLLVFTISMSWVVAFISSMYSPPIVATAALLTALMMIGLTTYACLAKTDFTMMGGILAAGSLVLIGMIFMGIFITNKFYHAAISAGIILLMSVYIIYDTQLIVGKHSYKYMIDDYILAALSLYLDIINLFISILQLLGSTSGN